LKEIFETTAMQDVIDRSSGYVIEKMLAVQGSKPILLSRLEEDQ